MSQNEASKILDFLKELDAKVNEHMSVSDEHWEETRQHMKDTKESLDKISPIIEALQFVQTFHKFLKWGGITIAAFIGVIYWVIKRI